MKTGDTCKLSPSAQVEKRKLAIRLWSRGESQKSVAQTVGVRPETMSRWVKRYRISGGSSLTAKQRGGQHGQNRHLTAEQEQSIQHKMTDKTPDQLKMADALWTRKAVMELIEQETGIKMPIRTVGEYLKRWGFTPHKPLKQAYEQNPKAVQQWLEDDYPKIKAQAKRENAEIYWGNACSVNRVNSKPLNALLSL